MTKNIKKHLKISVGITSILGAGVLITSCDTTGEKVSIKKPNPIDDSNNKRAEGNNKFKDDNQKRGEYIIYNSKSTDDFLKPNNKYLFRALKIDPSEEYQFNSKPEVYNNEEWRNYIPKVFISKDEFFRNDKIPIFLIRSNSNLPKNKDSSRTTLEPESPVGLWELLRNFTKKENGIVKKDTDINISETYKRFIKQMKDYLKPYDPAIDGKNKENRNLNSSNWTLEDENKKSEIKNQNDLSKHIYLFWNKTWNDDAKEKIRLILDDDKNFGDSEATKILYKSSLSNLANDLSNSWTIDLKGDDDSDTAKRFFLPFTRAKNPNWQKKFPKSALHFDKNTTYIQKGALHYYTWNSYLGNSWDAIKFESYEKHIRTMFERILDFYTKLSKVNKSNNDSSSVTSPTIKWSKLVGSEADNSLKEFKKSADSLMDILTTILYWTRPLGKEYENVENPSETIAHLFPEINRSDLEYNFVFAYRFLYDTLIPIYSANGWEFPLSFSVFYFEMITEQFQSHHVYKYAFKYINTIFKHKFRNFKELEIQNIADTWLKKPEVIEANKKNFLEFLRTWKPRLDINISDTEY